MSKHLWKVLVPLGALLSLSGCMRHFVPLKNYTRTESFDLEHARWLHAHCDLVRVAPTLNPGNVSSDQGNYVQVVGQERKMFEDMSSLMNDVSLVFACNEPTPWPREDRARVRIYHKDEIEVGQPLVDRCNETDPTRAKATFTVVDAGSGAAPSRDSYVGYRISPIVVIPANRKGEAEEWGVVAGPRRSWETANHILCSNFRDALLALKRGGKAHVSSLEQRELLEGLGVKGDMVEWDIELLDIGSVDLLYKHVGLLPDSP